jgi:retron-type reverse transcriptase
VIDPENLVLAAQKASRGKRYRRSAMAFNSRMGDMLVTLRKELLDRTYRPGKYRTFEIREPKTRMISAAPFRDRVVHHALCNVVEPLFEKTFIHDTYANRRGFGTHRALRRFTEFARAKKYVLQCDISKYFPSIDHEILKERIRRKIKCRDTLWLVDLIIDNSNEQDAVNMFFANDDLFTPFERRRGLPIGNLTSQFFANIYLSGLDHFVKEKLGIRCYIRYVDDFALFSDEHSQLADARGLIEEYLAGLRLRIHPVKSQLFETRRGASFVGYRVLEDRIRVRSDNLRRGRWRLRRMQREYAEGRLEQGALTQRLRSWIAHLEHADSFLLRKSVFGSQAFVKGCTK